MSVAITWYAPVQWTAGGVETVKKDSKVEIDETSSTDEEEAKRRMLLADTSRWRMR
jgi:hypothetical protein